MLNEMLQLLDTGGMHSTAELARRLHVGEALVRLMVEDLTRRGYLTALQTDCATSCSGCALSGVCGTHDTMSQSAPLLALTGKGRQAIGSG